MDSKEKDFELAMNILKSVFFRVEHLRKVAIRYNNPEDGTDYLDIRYYNDDYCYGILRVNNKGKVEKIDLDKYAENGLDEDVYRDAMLELDADYEDINTDNPWESTKEVVKADKIIVIDDGEIQKQKNPGHIPFSELEAKVADKVFENTEEFPPGATLGEEEDEDYYEEIEDEDYDGHIDASKIEKVVRAGVVTEEDVLKAKLSGKVEDRPVGTGWVEVAYRTIGDDKSDDIACMYADSRGYFETTEEAPYLDKKYIKLNYTELIEDEVAAYKEIAVGDSFNDMFRADYDKIDRSNAWNSLRAFVRENNLPIEYREDKAIEREERGFGTR